MTPAGSAWRRIGSILLAGGLLLWGSGTFAAEGVRPEIVDRTRLRVCADPNNLPFSNQAGEGFENRIAELLAAELGVDLAYTWYPQATGFVRNTLGARVCDVVMGVATTNELMQNTNPYYRSTYALVQRADARPKVTSITDPALKDLKIGVIARTPPVSVLAREGLLGKVVPYHLTVDTRYYSPARDLVMDVARGKIDIGVLWGPIAGYWAKKQDIALEVVPLMGADEDVRLDFRISMGLRRNEPQWKHQLDEFIREHNAEIQQILLDYGVPLLDERGALIAPAAGDGKQGQQGMVPEPAGYRMGEYRAPVPAGLSGARTVTTAELQGLIANADPVLIDVLPAPRAPENRAQGRLWRAKPRANIPGSVWLPNVGYGELSDEFDAWFRDHLGRLTAGARGRPLVFYCQENCWMSWNAAKRALALGYKNVVWYPEGTDGWAKAGLVLEPATPLPMPDFVPLERRPRAATSTRCAAEACTPSSG